MELYHCCLPPVGKILLATRRKIRKFIISPLGKNPSDDHDNKNESILTRTECGFDQTTR